MIERSSMLVASGRWIGALSVVAVASATQLVACVELKDPLPAPPTETSPESGRADGSAGDDAATDGSAGDDANASATQDAGIDSGTGTAKVESLTVGENVACVVFEQGVMRCWGSSLLAGGGDNNLGQAGKDPGGAARSWTLHRPDRRDHPVERRARRWGWLRLCALTDASGGRRVYCWGTGGAVLGDGATVARA